MKIVRRMLLPVAFMFASAISIVPMTPAVAAVSSIPVPANSGTAEGTAALIKATPKLSAGAYALGMPADEAVAKMKGAGMFNAGVDIRPSIGFKFSQLPDHSFIGGSHGKTKVQSGDSEDVGLLFTMYPNMPVVSGISRELSFTPATAPNVGNTLAELRKKYGPESGTHANGLFWLFDYEGHPLSKEQIAELQKSQCVASGPGAGGGMSASNIVNTDIMGGKISKGYDKVIGGNFNNPACLNTVRVDAQITISEPSSTQDGWSGKGVYMSKTDDWARATSDVVEELLITVRDTPLDYSASTVSRNTVLNGGAAEQQKKRDAAEKRKPSL